MSYLTREDEMNRLAIPTCTFIDTSLLGLSILLTGLMSQAIISLATMIIYSHRFPITSLLPFRLTLIADTKLASERWATPHFWPPPQISSLLFECFFCPMGNVFASLSIF